MFPARFTLETGDGEEVSVEIRVDGTWSGDGEGFLKAADQLDHSGDLMDSVFVWMLIRAIKNDLNP